MYCSSCGRSAEDTVRFCPNCGVQVGAGFVPPGAAYPAGGYPEGKLVRPRYPRMIAGVCSAFALQYGWDIAVVRLVTVVIALFTSGIGFLAYLAAWIIIPEAQYALPPQVRPGVPPPPGYGGPVAPGEPGAASNSAGNTAV